MTDAKSLLTEITTLSRVRDCIDRVLCRDAQATADQRLAADVGLDSLEAIELELQLEEEFKLDPSALDMRFDEATTVADVARVVDELRGVAA